MVQYETVTTEQLNDTFAALADPTRRAILARLANGEATVTELAEPFAISLPAISKHLKVLDRARALPALVRRPALRDAARDDLHGRQARRRVARDDGLRGGRQRAPLRRALPRGGRARAPRAHLRRRKRPRQPERRGADRHL